MKQLSLFLLAVVITSGALGCDNEQEGVCVGCPDYPDTKGTLHCAINGQPFDFPDVNYVDQGRDDPGRLSIGAGGVLYKGNDVSLLVYMDIPPEGPPVTRRMDETNSTMGSFDAGYRGRNDYGVFYYTMDCIKQPSGSITITHEGKCYRGSFSFKACYDGKLNGEPYSELSFTDGRFDICED